MRCVVHFRLQQDRLQVDVGELYFLLLHFLGEGPCRQAAASLQQEALQHQLLPARTDFRGTGSCAAIMIQIEPWTCFCNGYMCQTPIVAPQTRTESSRCLQVKGMP